MDAKTDPPSIAAPTEISLVRGGPFYRVQRTIGLLHTNRWNIGRRIMVLIAISWLPLVLITVFFNREGLHSLLTDYRVYTRLFIAIPALLVGELLMDVRFRAVLVHVREADLLDPPEMAYMDGIIATLVRLRDSFLPEIIILILIAIRIDTSYRGLVDTTPWMGQVFGDGYRFTAAGWYGLLVSAPLWNFLLGLALWRWLMWTFLAFKLSRRDLKLVPTHPDKRGGLGFLSLTVLVFAPIAFAAASVIGATWRHDILRHGAHVVNFKLSAIVMVVIVVLVALGPLIFFVPRLSALRRRGILEYGILGQMHSTEFHKKWILDRAGHEAGFLRAREINTLADFGDIYEKIGQMQPFPADITSLYGLAAAMAIPALFVVITEIPLAVVLDGLLKAVR